MDINSLMVSKIFGAGGKSDHGNTMVKIKELMKLGVLGFKDSSYINAQRKKQPMYTMDLVAFTMLVNRYTVPRVIDDDSTGEN